MNRLGGSEDSRNTVVRKRLSGLAKIYPTSAAVSSTPPLLGLKCKLWELRRNVRPPFEQKLTTRLSPDMARPEEFTSAASMIALVSLRSEKVDFPSAGSMHSSQTYDTAQRLLYPISALIAAVLLARAGCTVDRTGQGRIRNQPTVHFHKMSCWRWEETTAYTAPPNFVSCAQRSCGKLQTGRREQNEHTLLKKMIRSERESGRESSRTRPQCHASSRRTQKLRPEEKAGEVTPTECLRHLTSTTLPSLVREETVRRSPALGRDQPQETTAPGGPRATPNATASGDAAKTVTGIQTSACPRQV